jgi:cobalamin biosynthesis protein CobW
MISKGEHDHEDFDTFVVDVPSFATPQELVDRIAKATGTPRHPAGQRIVEIAGKPMRLLVQGVGARIQHQFDRPWHSRQARQGRLVVIGEKGFDREAIRGHHCGLNFYACSGDTACDPGRERCRHRSRPVAG